MKILIMGMPETGKSTLANQICLELKAKLLNADQIREKFDDWDFTERGRIRQAYRMRDLAIFCDTKDGYVVCDFICPTPETRKIFNADFTVWVDTKGTDKYDDTNRLFTQPETYDFRVTTKDAQFWTPRICRLIEKTK